MKYLLDTHAIIWLIEDSSKMPSEIKEIVKLPENDIFICSVSFWEIVIKMSLGKLSIGLPFDELLAHVKNSDIIILHIEDSYLKRLFELPFLHKDPFDRLIVSTAQADDLTIITIDDNIQKYDVSWVW